MKNVLYLVASLSALASAASMTTRNERLSKKSCSEISYGTCTGGIEKFGRYHWKNYCNGQIVNLKASDYVVEDTVKEVSFDACVLGCSKDTICCAVNYEKCGGVCEYLARTDGTDLCYKTPIVLEKGGAGYQSSKIVPPSEVPGSIYGGN